MARCHYLILPAALMLIPHAVQAASFDCKAARSAQERLVCATPALSALDDRLAAAFKVQLDGLSPEGQDLLRKDERNWLTYTDHLCFPPRKAANTGSSDECLRSVYDARVAALKNVTTKTAGWTFQLVTSRRAVPVSGEDDGSGKYPGFATNEVSYLRIDAPSTPATRQWNQRLGLSPAAAPDVDTDVETTVRLNLATPNFLSMTTDAYFLPHGRPHGHGMSKVTNVILSPPVREATPNDLFKDGEHWKTIVGDAAFHQVQKAAIEQDVGIENETLESAKADALSMGKWQIKPEGIVIQYDQYELGTYVFTPTVRISWSALRGEMKPNSPIAGAIDLPAR